MIAPASSQGIDRDLRKLVRFVVDIQRLQHDQLPSVQGRVFERRSCMANDSGSLHLTGFSVFGFQFSDERPSAVASETSIRLIRLVSDTMWSIDSSLIVPIFCAMYACVLNSEDDPRAIDKNLKKSFPPRSAPSAMLDAIDTDALCI